MIRIPPWVVFVYTYIVDHACFQDCQSKAVALQNLYFRNDVQSINVVGRLNI